MTEQVDFTQPLSSFFPNPIRIIGVSGRKRSGKDTIGTCLERNYHFNRESFAWPLKEATRVMFGWNMAHTDGDLKEWVDPYWKVTPRSVMQRLGTEVGRQIDEEMWIKSMYRRLVLHAVAMRKRLVRLAAQNEHLSWNRSLNIVITDVRFPNEMNFVRSLGGEAWLVTRSSLGERTDLHISETALDGYPFDRELVNDGSLQDLYKQVDGIMAAESAFGAPGGPRELHAPEPG